MTSTLTPGERLVRCFLGQDIDRIPFGIGLGWYAWGETKTRWRNESGIASLQPESYFGYDPGFASPDLLYGAWPSYPKEIIEENDEFIIMREERGIIMRQRRDQGSMPEFLEHPIKTTDDWARMKAERLQPDAPGRIRQDWDAFRARIAASGEAVQVGNFPWGIFGTVRDLMGAEEVLMAFYDEPAMIHDMMDTMTTIWLRLYEQVAREVQIDHIHIWEDMAGRQGSLISPAMVREFMMPYYDRIVDFARANNIRIVSVDTDGDCSQLVPIFMEHGVNMMFPFEVQAGCDILDYREKYPTLGITGGLDKRALASGHAAIDAEIEKFTAMLAEGRYVPAWDHLIPPDVGWDNMVYATERIKTLCMERC